MSGNSSVAVKVLDKPEIVSIGVASLILHEVSAMRSHSAKHSHSAMSLHKKIDSRGFGCISGFVYLFITKLSCRILLIRASVSVCTPIFPGAILDFTSDFLIQSLLREFRLSRFFLYCYLSSGIGCLKSAVGKSI